MEDLLQPQHPLNQQHQAQLALLRALPAPQREEQARLLRLGNAAYRYQQLAEGEVTEDDFRDWLSGLPEKLRAAMEREGFEQHRAAWPLRRHALERRDKGYDEFMRALLSPADWAFEQALRQPPTIAAPDQS